MGSTGDPSQVPSCCCSRHESCCLRPTIILLFSITAQPDVAGIQKRNDHLTLWHLSFKLLGWMPTSGPES
ncbi:hypothetical protein AV530_013923 [Patagioenas fasciata monilis]|uniref:Uncharacterized protein n=1 Tax=Patagioenas fasciata monilis TaxID=372326 RepID=A0A1V4KN22_PATFA|nr:hypothetical protein AV530_013923 [Patagioenas fasciata monilis]